MNLLAISGLSLVLFFVILILIKRNKQIKDFLLIAFFILIGCELLYRYFNISVINEKNNWIIILDLIYWAALGSVMYLYIVFTTVKNKKIKLIHLFHLLPVILVLIPFFGFLNYENNNLIFFQFVKSSNLFNKIIIELWDFICPIYYMFVLIKLHKHKLNVTSYYSTIHKRDLKWAFYLSTGFMVYVVVGFIAYYIKAFTNLQFEYPFSQITISILVLYVFGIGIFGYRQNGVFSEHTLKEINQFNLHLENYQAEIIKKKYEKSGLDKNEAYGIIQGLQELMQTEKEYLDFELNINQLADKLNTSMHKLSQIINSEFQQNFYDFINSYRIEEVKKRLNSSKYKDYKIMSIAYDCGFNSRSAFYSSFKKATNITPTQYRKEVQKKNIEVFSN